MTRWLCVLMEPFYFFRPQGTRLRALQSFVEQLWHPHGWTQGSWHCLHPTALKKITDPNLLFVLPSSPLSLAEPSIHEVTFEKMKALRYELSEARSL